MIVPLPHEWVMLPPQHVAEDCSHSPSLCINAPAILFPSMFAHPKNFLADRSPKVISLREGPFLQGPEINMASSVALLAVQLGLFFFLSKFSALESPSPPPRKFSLSNLGNGHLFTLFSSCFYFWLKCSVIFDVTWLPPPAAFLGGM